MRLTIISRFLRNYFAAFALLLFIFVSNLLIGQSTPMQMKAALDDDCIAPRLQAKAVIATANDAVAYLRFEAMDNNNNPYYYRMVGGELLPATLTTKDVLLFEHLNLNQKFEIYATNTCAEFGVVATFDTYTGKQDAIEVSSPFYDEIVRFQKQKEETTLTTFIADEIKGVSFYEKVAFIQQFYLKGQAIKTFSHTELPLVDMTRMMGEDCRCDFIFNLTEFAAPAIAEPDGVLENNYQEQPKIPLNGNNDADVWWNRANKGPSKWHALLTEGGSAGSTQLSHTISFSDSTDVGINYAKLRYNFMCVNYSELPRECECKKPLNLYYRYNSRAEAFAKKKPGWLNRNGFAAAQDIGITVLTVDGINDPQVLAAGIVRADAKCDYVVNPEFWGNVSELAIDVALIAFGVSNAEISAGFNVDSFAITLGVTNIAQNLSNVITTPYTTSNSCNAASASATLCQGDTLVYLVPNEPITLYQYSFSKLTAGGKRSWFSWGHIVSDFYLLGYVPGGYLLDTLGEAQELCCTRKIANWILGSCDNPSTNHELKGEVGSILDAFAPWPFADVSNFGTGIPSTDFGWISKSSGAEGCDGIKIENGNIIGDDSAAEKRVNTSAQFIIIRVFDAIGRLLYQTDIDVSDALPLDFNAWLRQVLGSTAVSGIYFVQTLQGDNRDVFKVLLP